MANRRGPIINRRHLARQEREEIQSRIITYVSYGIVALVLLVVGIGLFNSLVIQPTQPVAIVEGEEISTREFRARVRYERNLLVNRWFSTQQTMQLFATDQNSQAFFQNTLNQIQIQLEPGTIGRVVLNDLIADRLIRAEAESRGITVSEEEIDAALEEFFGYFGGEQPPTPTPFPTVEPTSTLTPLQMTLTAPTPTPVLTGTTEITSTTGITGTTGITATDTISGTDADDVAVPTPEPQPTPTAFTEDAFRDAYSETIDILKDEFQFTEEDLRYLIESQLFEEKLLDALTVDVERNQDQVWARHILVPDEETALEVIGLLDAGEDFASLAALYSTDTGSVENGGDLGWFGIGVMDQNFEKVAFNLAIGEVSEPVQSQFGYHVIQVLGHEMRPLTNAEYEQLRRAAFDEWLSRARLDATVETMDYWSERTPDDPSIPAGGFGVSP
jgi:parvulin-like peptidyl-prolyl isomerase